MALLSSRRYAVCNIEGRLTHKQTDDAIFIAQAGLYERECVRRRATIPSTNYDYRSTASISVNPQPAVHRLANLQSVRKLRIAPVPSGQSSRPVLSRKYYRPAAQRRTGKVYSTAAAGRRDSR